MYYLCRYSSPIGMLTLASDGSYLTGLWIQEQKFFAYNHTGPIEKPDLPVFRETVTWLDGYFAGDHLSPFPLPLKPAGTQFQRQVWDILQTIPRGQTVTYGQIASQLGRPGSSRAVGAAVGRNPIAIVIPCHRVLGADGKLTGFAGGVSAKSWLLRHEGISVQK